MDQANQANTYNALVAWKAASLITSLVRSLNCGELIAPSHLARALIEHAAGTLFTYQEVAGVLNGIGQRDKPVLLSETMSDKLEVTLVKAIWGTRFGTSKKRDKTMLWEQSPYIGETIGATAIATQIQKMADLMGDFGDVGFKAYEWLCDIVHPATQGFRVFWDHSHEVARGHKKYRLLRGGSETPEYIYATVLWAAGYSCVVLKHTVINLSKSVNNVYARLKSVYQIAIDDTKP